MAPFFLASSTWLITFWRCLLLTSGPMSVAGSSPFPTFIFDAFFVRLSMNSSAISSSTIILFGLVHTCPQLVNLPQFAAFTASSRSAVGSTMKGSLPPSSRDSLWSLFAEFCIIFLPSCASCECYHVYV